MLIGVLALQGGFAAHARMRDRDYDGCSTCSRREECGHCRAYVTASGAEFFGNDRVCLDAVPGRRGEYEAQRGVVRLHPVTPRRSLPVLP